MKLVGFRRIITVALLSTALLAPTIAPCDALAEEARLDAQGPTPIKTVLEKLVGKKVTLRVSAGDEISGTVGDVGPSGVVIQELSGREFFSAVVRIDSIVAVIARQK